MNNTELTLDQLQTINGGRVIAGNAGPGGSTFMTEKTGANPSASHCCRSSSIVRQNSIS